MSKLNIGIIQGSVREENNGTAVANYILDYAKKRDDANYELVDLASYNLPLLGSKYATEEQGAAVGLWQEKMAEFDAFIFLTPEYNHTVSGALTNALDFLRPQLENKASGLVGYGSMGGVRAQEHMRQILAEFQNATVRTTVMFSLMADFENMTVFNPNDYHVANIDGMLDQLIAWGTAFKGIRK